MKTNSKISKTFNTHTWKYENSDIVNHWLAITDDKGCAMVFSDAGEATYGKGKANLGNGGYWIIRQPEYVNVTVYPKWGSKKVIKSFRVSWEQLHQYVGSEIATYVWNEYKAEWKRWNTTQRLFEAQAAGDMDLCKKLVEELSPLTKKTA